jgi:penicillin amidase
LAALDSSPDGTRLARAYSDGVNAYIDQMPANELPLEFRLLGIKKPSRWAPINSIHLLNRMGWTLAYSTQELDRALAATRVGAAAAASLFPDNSPIQEPIQPNGRKAARMDFARLSPPGAPDTAAAPLVVAALTDLMPASSRSSDEGRDDVPRGFASNSWAVGTSRSATGPLLAGDPHLDLTLPSIWYEAHVVVPGALDVYGVTIPGAPGIIIGFNRDVAWTFTNTGADVLDLYAERVDDDAHPTRYQVDGEWRTLERRVETYRGKAGEVLAVDTLYRTHRGPMRRERGRWLSMRWTVLEPSNESAAFQAVAHVRDVAEFHKAMAQHYWAPAQNMLAVDHQGIAIRSTGHFPVRPGGTSGFALRDGTTSASDWRGFLPPEFYPQSRDPEQGYLASANQQPIDPRAASYWFGGEYDPWRAVRINQLLRADSVATVEHMRLMQTDPGSARADYFVPFFLAAARRPVSFDAIVSTAERTKLAEAARLLGEWDRRYTRENKRAVLFEAAYRELVNRTWDELERPPANGGAAPVARAITPSSPVLAELLSDSGSVWWDDRRTSEKVETRDDILAASLLAALDSTRARYGEPNGDGWRWDRIRKANIWHLLHLPSLSALALPVQGGPSTLSPVAGSGTFGASWRMVVEAGKAGSVTGEENTALRAWGTYPGGQSGNPASSRYTNHLPRWLAGELEPLLVPRWIPELTEAQTSSRLMLRP